MRAAIATVIGTCWLFSATAHADKIAIIGVEIAGDAVPELASQLARSIGTGLAAEGAEVVSLEDVQVALRRSPELLGCTSTACLQRVGEKVEAAAFVRAKMDGTGAAYTLELSLLAADADNGVVRTVTETCAACTVTELNEMASKAAAQLVSGETAPVAVVIATEPVGANVLIDGDSVGTSPYTGTLSPGPHKVTARLDGHSPAEKTITVTPDTGSPQNFELSLSPIRAIEPVAENPRTYRVWKWVTAGGSAVWLVTGIALIAIDGNQTCDRGPLQKQCPEIYDTLLTGILSTGVGVGLGAVSGYMFYKDHQAANPGREATVTPTRGGAMATVRWRF